jgi:hypothetical protein
MCPRGDTVRTHTAAAPVRQPVACRRLDPPRRGWTCGGPVSTRPTAATCRSSPLRTAGGSGPRTRGPAVSTTPPRGAPTPRSCGCWTNGPTTRTPPSRRPGRPGLRGRAPTLTTPIKHRVGRRLTGDQRTVNLLRAATRGPAERGTPSRDELRGAASGPCLSLAHRRDHRRGPGAAAPRARPHYMINQGAESLLEWLCGNSPLTIRVRIPWHRHGRSSIPSMRASHLIAASATSWDRRSGNVGR